MQDRIREKLTKGLQLFQLEIVNESELHAGHTGDDGSGESHFRLTVVSENFEGKGRIERQRVVYDLLQNEMETGIHALSLKVLTPDEYDRVQ